MESIVFLPVFYIFGPISLIFRPRSKMLLTWVELKFPLGQLCGFPGSNT